MGSCRAPATAVTSQQQGHLPTATGFPYSQQSLGVYSLADFSLLVRRKHSFVEVAFSCSLLFYTTLHFCIMSLGWDRRFTDSPLWCHSDSRGLGREHRMVSNSSFQRIMGCRKGVIVPGIMLCDD